MPERPVKWVSISDWYDGPLEGWCRIDGTYCYFKWTNEDYIDREYSLYLFNSLITIEHLLHVRLFRRMVGWHSEILSETTVRKPCDFDMKTHPNWKDFQNLPKPDDLDLDAGMYVGSTMDFKVAQMSPDWRIVKGNKR